jgi:hypothetical protein
VSGGPDLVWLLPFACFLRPVGTPFSSARSEHCRLPTVGTDPTPPAAANYHLATSCLSSRRDRLSLTTRRAQCEASSCLRLLVASPPHHSSGEIPSGSYCSVLVSVRSARASRIQHLSLVQSTARQHRTRPHFLETANKPALISNKLAGRVWRRVTSRVAYPSAHVQGSRDSCTDFSAPVRCAPH